MSKILVTFLGGAILILSLSWNVNLKNQLYQATKIIWEMRLNQLTSSRNALALVNKLASVGYRDSVLVTQKYETERVLSALGEISTTLSIYQNSYAEEFNKKVVLLEDDFKRGDPWVATANLSKLIVELESIEVQ